MRSDKDVETKVDLGTLRKSLTDQLQKYITQQMSEKNEKKKTILADTMAVWNEAQRLLGLNSVKDTLDSVESDKHHINELLNYLEKLDITINPGFLRKNIITTLGKSEKKQSAPLSNLRASTIFSIKDNEVSASIETNVGTSPTPKSVFPEDITKDFVNFYKDVSSYNERLNNRSKSWHFSYPLTNGEVIRQGIGEWQNKMMVVSPSVKESLDAKGEKIEPDLSIEDLNKRTEDLNNRIKQVYLAVAGLGGMKDFLRDTKIEGVYFGQEKDVDAVLAALDQLVAKADKDPHNQFLLKEWLMANGGQEMNRFFDDLLYNDKEFSEGDLKYAPATSKGRLGNWSIGKEGKLEFELACDLYDLTVLNEEDLQAIPFVIHRDRNGDVNKTDVPINVYANPDPNVDPLKDYLPLIQYHAKAQLEIVDGKVKPKITYLEVAAFGTDALLSPQRKFGAPEQKVESKEEVKSTTTYTPKM